MRLRQILLLASAILFVISAGLYFFAPDLKEDLMEAKRTKVIYKKLKTLEGREEAIRENRRNIPPKKLFNYDSKKTMGSEPKVVIVKALKAVRTRLVKDCDDVLERLNEYPDLIDYQSSLYQNRGKVEDFLNHSLGNAFDIIRLLKPSLGTLKEQIMQMDRGSLKLQEFEKISNEYDSLIASCGVNDGLGPLVLTLTEVIKEINPAYTPFLVKASTNMATAYFEIETYEALFLGAGLLRNMNSHGILSQSEAYDLEVLSGRLRNTYDNFKFEWKKAKTIEEKQDVLVYFNEEAIVLAELFKEFTYKIQTGYSAYSIQR